MNSRYRADQTTLDELANEVLVVCPTCAGRATVRLRALEEPRRAGPFRATHEARLSCTRCGHNARKDGFVRRLNGPGDSIFGCPVWLAAPCCGHTLWAYNARHLDALEDFVRATLRERLPNSEGLWRNQAWVSRIPRWISSARNRDEVLRCIARLRRERLGPAG